MMLLMIGHFSQFDVVVVEWISTPVWIIDSGTPIRLMSIRP